MAREKPLGPAQRALAERQLRECGLRFRSLSDREIRFWFRHFQLTLEGVA